MGPPLDGLSPHEGHIFVATTNKGEELDQALTRPGRMNLSHIELTHATKHQARLLFQRFYADKMCCRAVGTRRSMSDAYYNIPLYDTVMPFKQ